MRLGEMHGGTSPGGIRRLAGEIIRGPLRLGDRRSVAAAVVVASVSTVRHRGVGGGNYERRCKVAGRVLCSPPGRVGDRWVVRATW